MKAGRWLWKAPIGYKNDTRTKTVVTDGDAAAFVRKAFSLIADGSYSSSDSVLRLLNAMGFTTPKGNPVSRQTFAKMLRNPFYAGWVISGDVRVKGNHEPIVSQELFDTVLEKLKGNTNGKVVHKKVTEDFPLRGYIKCEGCGKNLTAGWSKGKGGQRFPYYFCWNRQCKNRVTVSREQLEDRYFSLLCAHVADAQVLAELPTLAARMWSTSKETLANDARLLARRLGEQETLNPDSSLRS